MRGRQNFKLKWFIQLHLLVYALLGTLWAIQFFNEQGISPTLERLGLAEERSARVVQPAPSPKNEPETPLN